MYRFFLLEILLENFANETSIKSVELVLQFAHFNIWFCTTRLKIEFVQELVNKVKF